MVGSHETISVEKMQTKPKQNQAKLSSWLMSYKIISDISFINLAHIVRE